MLSFYPREGIKRQFLYNSTASPFILLPPYCSSIAAAYVESSTNALLSHLRTVARQDPEMVAGQEALLTHLQNVARQDPEMVTGQ
jgi:hypothetical protein